MKKWDLYYQWYSSSETSRQNSHMQQREATGNISDIVTRLEVQCAPQRRGNKLTPKCNAWNRERVLTIQKQQYEGQKKEWEGSEHPGSGRWWWRMLQKLLHNYGTYAKLEGELWQCEGRDLGGGGH
jgi:hypothetical protein